jgi:hypothetical protein
LEKDDVSFSFCCFFFLNTLEKLSMSDQHSTLLIWNKQKHEQRSLSTFVQNFLAAQARTLEEKEPIIHKVLG